MTTRRKPTAARLSAAAWAAQRTAEMRQFRRLVADCRERGTPGSWDYLFGLFVYCDCDLPRFNRRLRRA
jgi:hypothetical protein